MKVVSNSSSLIFLSALGLLDVLRIEFDEVLIPEMVYQEVTANDLKGFDAVKDAGNPLTFQSTKVIRAVSSL
jgi:predicted nucleic acid-binding protein